MQNEDPRAVNDRTGKKKAKVILIVDDEVDITSTFTLLFQLHGYETLTAGNGREAIELLKTQRPDLIFSDAMMPVMDGLELSRQVRKIQRIKKTPIILTSAVPLSQKASDAGFDVFLQKPVKFKDILDAVERLLGAGPTA